jgi:hypothetical protein
MIGNGFYNCVPIEGNESRAGFGKLGVDAVGSLIARGVLIDVAALKGVPVLPDNYEITPQDLQQALARQKLALKPGDAILIHTGWGTLWGEGQRALREELSGHRHRGRDVARETGSDARRRRQLASRSRPEPESAAVASGPPAHARRQRDPSARELEARRAIVQARPRVRLRRPAAQDKGRHDRRWRRIAIR